MLILTDPLVDKLIDFCEENRIESVWAFTTILLEFKIIWGFLYSLILIGRDFSVCEI